MILVLHGLELWMLHTQTRRMTTNLSNLYDPHKYSSYTTTNKAFA